MKKKFLLISCMAVLLVCLFTISVNAKEMTNYCDAKITFTSGETVTAYFYIGAYDNCPSIARDNIYKSTNTDDGTYSWSDVQVIDFRNFNYTEGYAPVSMYGTNCNSIASNVTTVYLPSTLTTILGTSFTSGWASLDTVYIGKELQIIKTSAFKCSPVRKVVIEENSKLKTLETEAFRECKNLESINLQEGLEKIGYCAFYITNLSGTFVVPNSVTEIGDAAFRTTKIETLIFGDGPVKIGYNVAGNDGQNKECLKNIYISAQSTFNESHLSEIWYANGSTINFYVIGDSDEEVQSFITSLKNTGRVKFATQKEIDNGTAISGYNAIIIEGYNKCAAFYSNVHNNTEVNSCVNRCERCGSTIAEHDENKALATIVEYADGFLTGGKKIIGCSNEGCPLNEAPETADLSPLFACIGYSAPENGNGGIVIGYTVNKKAIAEYKELTGATLKYGVFAVSKNKLKDNDIFTNGEASDGVIAAEIKTDHVAFELKIKGFETEKQKTSKLAMGAYVEVTKDETTAYSYMQYAEASEGEKYHFITFDEAVELANKA